MRPGSRREASLTTGQLELGGLERKPDMKTVSFEVNDQRSLALDIFEPTEAIDRTAVLILHGGGWRHGSRTAVHPRAEALAGLGFTTFAVEYRLLDEAPWPAQLEDACSAISFVRDRAEDYGVSRDRIVIQGHSAGGQIALLAGTKCNAAAVIAYYPPIGFHVAVPPPPAAGALGEAVRPSIAQADDGTVPSYTLFGEGTSDEEIIAASPIHQVSADSPPTLLLHGGADWLLKPFSSVVLYERLVNLGVACDLHLYSGQVHEFDLAPALLDITAREVALFIRRTVSATEKFNEEARTFNPMFSRSN